MALLFPHYAGKVGTSVGFSRGHHYISAIPGVEFSGAVSGLYAGPVTSFTRPNTKWKYRAGWKLSGQLSLPQVPSANSRR